MGKIDLKQYDFLNSHLQQRLADKSWLYPCVEENKANAFPYLISSSEPATLGPLYFPKKQSKKNPTHRIVSSPKFIINLPEGRAPHLSNDAYQTILTRLQTEAFENHASFSKPMVLSRLAVVIGTNQIHSLDSKLNRAFIRLIEKTKRFSGLAARRFGFLWMPKYFCSVPGPLQKRTAEQAFRLLKAYDTSQAEKVRQVVESNLQQIPFQKIRERILKSTFTQEFADWFQTHADTSPIYLTVMDPDFLDLRIEKGVFTKISNKISINPSPSVIGCGYLAKSEEFPIIQLAVQIDMAVREAMLRHIRYSAYLPEPCLSVLLKKPNQNHHLDSLSFLGDGESLESRRLIQNGIRTKVLDQQMTFITDGIVTTTPTRWKTEKNCSYERLTSEDIKTKPILQAIRGLAQSHVHPKKWADQIYVALPFSCSRVTDATAPIMHIFGIFDPISRMFAHLDRFSAVIFDQEMNAYQAPLTPTQQNVFNAAKGRLQLLNMSDAMINQITAAAQGSGRAIHKKLEEASREPL